MIASEYDTLAQQLREALGPAAVDFLEQTYTDPVERLQQIRKALTQAGAKR